MSLTKTSLRQHLINSGVRDLREFGYPDVSPDNIMTDAVYSRFFTGMLEENRGVEVWFDELIDQLIAEMASCAA